jgi:hypothetical protein
MATVTNPTVLSYTAPATFTDTTPIPSGTITKFQYGFGAATGNYTVIVDDIDLTVDAKGKQTGPVPGNLAFGTWFSAFRTVTKDGATSAWSNEIQFVIAAKTPSPGADFGAA